MKTISLLCFLATSFFLAGNIVPAKNTPSLNKEITFNAVQNKTSPSIQGVWIVEKLHHVIFGKYSAYERNRSNNTGIDYDNLRFTFYANGTGIHIDQYRRTYSFQWKFTSPDQRTAELIVNGTVFNWDMLVISGKYLNASAHLNIGGDADNVETFRLVKVDGVQNDETAVPGLVSASSKTQILTGNTWIVDEVKSNVRGKNLDYRKDRFNNTGEDYSIYSLSFNADGTGTYTDGIGTIHQTTWKFTSEDEHNMRLTLDSGGFYDWSMIEISENSFQSITRLNINGHDLLQSTRLVPQGTKCNQVNQ